MGLLCILFLFEEWQFFTQSPLRAAFSPGGLTWYGGFLLGMLAVYIYIRRKKVPYLQFLDALGIALILAYGVGRLGCHFSGDGDYGYPTTLPWGTIYAQGTAKPSYVLEEYFKEHPAERTFWHYDSLRVIPAGVDKLGSRFSKFDEVTPLHPAPVYELILGIVGFVILWNLRKRNHPDGWLFMVYLILAGLFRFLIEFMRLNPRLLLGLTEAQLFSIVIIAAGVLGVIMINRKTGPKAEAA